MAGPTLDNLISKIRADTNQMRLLDVLGGQLKLLIDEERPDLRVLLTSLKAEALVSEEDYNELKAAYALDMVSPPVS
jgi:hypothetical protein